MRPEKHPRAGQARLIMVEARFTMVEAGARLPPGIRQKDMTDKRVQQRRHVLRIQLHAEVHKACS